MKENKYLLLRLSGAGLRVIYTTIIHTDDPKTNAKTRMATLRCKALL